MFERITLASLPAIFLLFLTPSAGAMVTLRAEINPDPAAPGELVDVQISVSSTTSTGNLTLRLPWPSGLNSFPTTTNGGGCDGSCSTGELLTWNLGSLAPGETRIVGFNEEVDGADGGAVPLSIELLDGGSTVATLEVEIDVRADSPLEIAVDPLSDPAAPGSQLVYEIVYGHTGSAAAADAELSFPIPSGTQFISATGGGVFSGSLVTWDLGSLAPNSGGRERVHLQVSPLAEGTLLLVDAVSITGSINFQPQEARATAVSRVGEEPLLLAAEIDPEPVRDGEMVDAQITVTNPGTQVTGNLALRLWWPGDEMQAFPILTDGGGCDGSCSTGEYAVWNLGLLGPGVSRTVAFNEQADSGQVSGSLVPFEVELVEGDRPRRTTSRTVLVQRNSPLELTVHPLEDPVEPGESLVYEVVYGNRGNASSSGSVMVFPLPAGTVFQSASGGGVFADSSVTWNLGDLAPNAGGRERVVVQTPEIDNALLEVDAAVLSGTINFLPFSVRARAVSRIATEALNLAVEVDPDPVNAGEMVEVQISVTNPTANATGSLALRMWWPGEQMDSFPFFTGGGCDGSCSDGEYAIWNLGVLGPGSSQVVNFNEQTNTVANGTLLPLEVELLEAGQPIRTVSHTLLVQTDSPLELAVEPLPDPVPPGGIQTYEILYGNRGSSAAQQTSLSFPVPQGTSFLSATGGGSASAPNLITWNLGTLAPGAAGRQQVQVAVGPLPPATLLEVDAASLVSQIDFQTRRNRARAISRVGSSPLALDVEVTPNPVAVGGNLDAEIRVTNTSASVSGQLFMRLRWSGEELDGFPTVIGGGCDGSCSTGEFMTWNLGLLGPGAAVDVGFNEETENVQNGRLIPIELELFEGSLPARTYAETVLVSPFNDSDMDGEADVLDFDDDNDQMPDWWEVANGLDPLNAADANQDPDGDGATNLEEFLAGSDPNVFDLLFADGFESGDLSEWTNSVP